MAAESPVWGAAGLREALNHRRRTPESTPRRQPAPGSRRQGPKSRQPTHGRAYGRTESGRASRRADGGEAAEARCGLPEPPKGAQAWRTADTAAPRRSRPAARERTMRPQARPLRRQPRPPASPVLRPPSFPGLRSPSAAPRHPRSPGEATRPLGRGPKGRSALFRQTAS